MQSQIQYVSTGDPATDIVTTLHAKGELGQYVEIAGVVYRRVKMGTAGAVAVSAGQVAWWEDRDDFVVTNDSSAGGIGNVAGIFLGAVVAGDYCWVATRSVSENVSVKFLDSVTVAPDATGLAVIPTTTDGRADCITSAAMTTVIGRTAGAQDGTSKLADVWLSVPGSE